MLAAVCKWWKIKNAQAPSLIFFKKEDDKIPRYGHVF
jgi:hypothetical protein